MKKQWKIARDKAAQVIAAICAATGAVLDETEYEQAQSVLDDIETQCHTLPDTARIVSEVEKAIGLGFTDAEFNRAARDVAQVLGAPESRLSKWLTSAPDAHLEAAYEAVCEPALALD